MPIQTDEDRPGRLRGRDGAAVFTEGAEESNAQVTNGITDVLIDRKDEMKRRCSDQLGDLFANAGDSYGRARAVGMTAREASSVISRAFKK